MQSKANIQDKGEHFFYIMQAAYTHKSFKKRRLMIAGYVPNISYDWNLW